jgi:hypothetical protein
LPHQSLLELVFLKASLVNLLDLGVKILVLVPEIYLHVYTLHLFLNFILSFLHLLTRLYIIWATFAPPPGRTCSALLFSDFVEGKT